MEIWLRLELEDEEPIPNPGFVRQGNAVRDGKGVLAVTVCARARVKPSACIGSARRHTLDSKLLAHGIAKVRIGRFVGSKLPEVIVFVEGTHVAHLDRTFSVYRLGPSNASG